GLSVDKAIDQLTMLPKRSALPVLKLLNSAVANAEHNFQLERKSLMVKTIVANEGPKLKRYRPRAFGRAAEILKRSSHITIVLEDLEKTTKVKAKTADKPKTDTVKMPAAEIKKAPAKRPTKPATKAKPTT